MKFIVENNLVKIDMLDEQGVVCYASPSTFCVKRWAIRFFGWVRRTTYSLHDDRGVYVVDRKSFEAWYQSKTGDDPKCVMQRETLQQMVRGVLLKTHANHEQINNSIYNYALSRIQQEKYKEKDPIFQKKWQQKDIEQFFIDILDQFPDNNDPTNLTPFFHSRPLSLSVQACFYLFRYRYLPSSEFLEEMWKAHPDKAILQRTSDLGAAKRLCDLLYAVYKHDWVPRGKNLGDMTLAIQGKHDTSFLASNFQTLFDLMEEKNYKKV